MVCGAGNSGWKGVGFCRGGSGVLGGVWIDAGRGRNGGGSWVIRRGLGMDLLKFGGLRGSGLGQGRCWDLQKERGGECWLFSLSLWLLSAGKRWWRNAGCSGFIKGWLGTSAISGFQIPQARGELELRGDWRGDTRLMPPKRRMGKLREGVRAERAIG